jgi:RHS repeat-associated protein
VTTTYVVNNVNEYTSSTTAEVTTGFQYDADGNLIAKADDSITTTYTFNILNQLTGVNGPGLIANYSYDPLGNRASQEINGMTTSFQIDPAGLGNVVATFNASGGVTAHYAYGFGVVSQISAAGTAGYYDFNNIGSAVGITGANGSYVNKYAYMPFGQKFTVAAGVSNPFTFVGQFGVRDDGTELLNMGARGYAPITGRFGSRDPLGLIGGDVNLQNYAANDPTREIDPAGLTAGVANLEQALESRQRCVAAVNKAYKSQPNAARSFWASFIRRITSVFVGSYPNTLPGKPVGGGGALRVGGTGATIITGIGTATAGVMIFGSEKQVLDAEQNLPELGGPPNDPVGAGGGGACPCQCPATPPHLVSCICGTAVTGHLGEPQGEAVKLADSQDRHPEDINGVTGTKATVQLPANVGISEGDRTNYFNTYVGIDGSYVGSDGKMHAENIEAGVSYSRKYDPQGSWNEFINAGRGSDDHTPAHPPQNELGKGSTITMELTSLRMAKEAQPMSR